MLITFTYIRLAPTVVKVPLQAFQRWNKFTGRQHRLAVQAHANKLERRPPAVRRATSEPCAGRHRRVRTARRCHAPWPTHGAPPSRREVGERSEVEQPVVRRPCESPRRRDPPLLATPD